MKILSMDIGGTFIKYALWEDGSLAPTRQLPTRAELGPKPLLDTLAKLGADYPDIQAVGVSFASQMDPHTGSITSATDTFPGFSGVPLGLMLSRQLGVPVTVDNDVNCAAIGEGVVGAAQGCEDFLCLTYGTGIGGAIVLGGKLHYGAAFAAGEVGHMTLHAGGKRCSCGRQGCYEAYASTAALISRVQEAHGLTLDGREICARYKAQTPGITETVEGWIDDVCSGLASCIHMLNPPLVVLGGGIMEDRTLFGRVQARLKSELLPNFRPVAVRSAQLGNRAGMLGAAIQAAERLKEKETIL